MSATSYLNFAVGLIEGTGLTPNGKPLNKFISLCILLPMSLLLNILVIIKFQTAKNEDVFVMAEVFESISTYTQSTVRKFMLFAHSKLIEELMKECELHWNYDLFGEKLGKTLHSKMEFCINLTKILAVGSVGTIALICLTAILDEQKPVPLICWTPENKMLTNIIFGLEVAALAEILYYVLAFDSFYLLMCCEIQVQFILMQKLIENINFQKDTVGECNRKLIMCVQHHKKLLRLHNILNKFYSEFFIVQYIMTVTAVAMQAYIILYSSASFNAVFKSVSYFIMIMFQLALYFMPASNIEIEAENFVIQLYNANWEDNENMKNSKHLLFMLMKSQKPLILLGGRMLHINRNEYIVLLRLAFTIATILGDLQPNGIMNILCDVLLFINGHPYKLVRMSKKKEKYLEFAIGFIKGSGLSENSRAYRKFISICILLPIELLLIILIIGKFPETKQDVLSTAEVLESLVTYLQLIVRKYILISKSHFIKKIIRDYGMFWDYRIFGVRNEKKIRRNMELCITVLQALIICGFVTVALFCFMAIIDKEKTVPFVCWTSNNEFSIGIVYFFEVITLLELLYLGLAFDGFYFLLCNEVRIQFFLLQKKMHTIFLDIGFINNKLWKKIRICAHHHMLLIRVHKQMNETFSVYFLIQYIITGVSGCIEYYILMYRSTSMSSSIKSLFYLISLMLQVAIFFIPASNIEIGAEKFSYEIYQSKWENISNSQVRRHLLFMLINSQKPLCMLGAGMIRIERSEYIKLFRGAFTMANLLGHIR